MDQPTQDQPLSEDQSAQETPPVADEGQPSASGQSAGVEPPAILPESKSTRISKFAVGFFGWYLMTFLFFVQVMDAESLMLCGGVAFIANIGILLFLLIKRSFFGWGMLSAMAVNLIVSLILGSVMNALCFIPFYKH